MRKLTLNILTCFKTFVTQVSNNLRVSLLTALLLEGITNFQIFHLILKALSDADHPQSFLATGMMKQMISVLTTFEILGENTFNEEALRIICIAFIIYVVLIIFLFLLLLYSLLYLKEFNVRRLAGIIAKICLVHSRAIFFLAQYYFIKYQSSSYNAKAPWWIIVGCVMNIIIALLNETVFYQFAKIKNVYATKNNYHHLILFIQKALALAFYALTTLNKQAKTETFAAIHGVFVLGYLYILYSRLPFYNLKVMKLSIICGSVSFYLAIVLILKASNVNSYTLETLALMLLPFVVKILLTIFHWRDRKILRGDFKTPEEAIHYATLLKSLAFVPTNPSKHLKAIPMRSLVSNGILVMSEIDVSKSQEKEYEQMVYSCIVQELEWVLKNNNNNERSVLLGVFLAKIYFKRLNNDSQMLKLLMQMKSQRLWIGSLNSLEMLKGFLMELVSRRSNTKIDTENLDIYNYFRVKSILTAIKSDISKEVLSHLNFWQMIKSDMIDIKTMYDLSKTIEKTSSRTVKLYKEKLPEFEKHCCASVIMFSVYLNLVREIPEDVNLIKSFMRIQKDSNLRHSLDIFSKEIAVIVNSPQKQPELIVNVSASTQTMFQMQNTDLIGRNVSCLFPPLFARHYVKLLQNFSKNPMADSKNKVISYGKTPSGQLFKLDIEFKVYPEISQEVKIMGIIRNRNEGNSLLLLGHDGEIIECDNLLRQELNILRSTSLQYLRMQNIFPLYEFVNRAFNTCYLREDVGTTTTQYGGGGRVRNGTLMTRRGILYSESRTEVYSSRNGSHTERLSILPMMESPRGPISTKGTLGTDQISGQAAYGMTKEKAEEICESYKQGKKIKLLALAEEVESRVEIEYNAKIEAHVIEGRVYKMLKLENLEVMKTKFHMNGVPAGMSSGLHLKQPRRLSRVKNLQLPLPNGFLNPRKTSIDQQKLDTGRSGVTLVTCTEENIVGEGQENHLIIEEKGANIPFESEEIPTREKVEGIVKIQYDQMSGKASSMVSAKSEKGRNLRRLNQVLDSEDSYTLPKKAWSVMCITLIGLTVLTIFNYIFSKDAVIQIQEELNISNGVNLRLCAAMVSWEQLTRIQLRTMGLKNDMQAGITSTIANLIPKQLNLIKENKNLHHRLVNSKTKSIFTKILRKDIVFRINMTSESIPVGPMDSFIATDLLINKIGEVYRVPYSSFFSQETIIKVNNAAFNIANDYLMSAEKLMTETQALLREIDADSIFKLKMILTLIIVGLVFFVGSFLVFSYKIFIDYMKLFEAIERTNLQHIDKRINFYNKLRDLFEENIHSDHFIETASMFLTKDKRKDLSNVVVKSPKNLNKKIQGRGLIKFLAKYLAVAIIPTLGLSGFFTESLIESINDFQTIDDINTQLMELSRGKYQASVLTGSLYMHMLFYNETAAMVRHDSPENQVKISINFFENFNSRLLEAFSDYDIDHDAVYPAVDNMLRKRVCEYLEGTDLTPTYCTRGTLNETLGILGMNTYYAEKANYYFNMFQSDPTFATSQAVQAAYVSALRPTIDTLEYAYGYLLEYVIDYFNNLSDELISKKIVRLVITMVSVAVCGILIQKVTIKQVKKLDMGRGKILKLVGIDIISENKALTYYLKTRFRKQNISLKSGV